MTRPKTKLCATVEALGHAQHFIGSDNCRFRLGSLVAGPGGRFVVSTVGEYRPITHTADDFKEIGWNRKYETYVFKAARGRHDCGCPKITQYSEIDSLPANDAKTATKNHEAMVARFVTRATRAERARKK